MSLAITGPLPQSLWNLGNTCFANALFQALSSSAIFNDYMSEFVGSFEHSAAPLRFAANLSSLMRTLSGPQLSAGTAVNIETLVKSFPPHLSSRAQEHDAHELLVFVRDQIDIANKNLNELQGTQGTRRNIFVGRFERQLQCTQCDHPKDSRFETFEELILALPTSTSSDLTLSG